MTKVANETKLLNNDTSKRCKRMLFNPNLSGRKNHYDKNGLTQFSKRQKKLRLNKQPKDEETKTGD